MNRILAPCLIVMCVAGPAHAQVAAAFLKWNNCAAEGGALAANFDCNTNTGSEVLVGSFVVTGATLPITAIEATIDIVGQDFLGIADPFGEPPISLSPLGSWWDLRVARVGALAVSSAFGEAPFADATQCTDYWAGQAICGAHYIYGMGGDPGRARLSVAFAVAPGTPTPVPVDDREYYAFRVTLGHARTTGANSLEGCCNKVVLAISQMVLTFSDESRTSTQSSYFDAVVSRQHESTACLAVPILNRTWGGLKQLYR